MRLVEIPSVRRYLENGKNGTIKDNLLRIDERLSIHSSYLQRVEERHERGRISDDECFRITARICGEMNTLREEALSLIPDSYLPSIQVLNQH